MSDRDLFAVAALTGFLASLDSSCPRHAIIRMAYEYADAMLRERGNHPEKPDSSTNHDAVPEAIADGQGRDNLDTPDHVGTGNTPSEAEIDALHAEIDRLKAVSDRAAAAWMRCEGVPWEGDLADAIEAGVAEIARLRDELQSATRHMELAEAAWLRETAGNSPVAIVLTDAEREAMATAAIACEGIGFVEMPATLRSLLSRLSPRT